MKNNFIKEILKMDLSKERKYTFMICLRSARLLSGNNLETGEYESKNINFGNISNNLYHSNQFSGLVCYLIFLEMIGTIFKPKNNDIFIEKKNPIHCALIYFGNKNLTEMEISAIRALRNSLAHNFGLAIVNQKNNDTDEYNLTHKFQLEFDTQSDWIIIPPQKRWNGNFSDKGEDTITRINEKNLIKLIEDVYQNVLLHSEKEELEIVLNGGIKELNTRFSII